MRSAVLLNVLFALIHFVAVDCEMTRFDVLLLKTKSELNEVNLNQNTVSKNSAFGSLNILCKLKRN